MSVNPYASPATIAKPDLITASVADPHELPIASQGKRFVNLIIDNIIIQVLSGMAGVVVGLVYAAMQISATGTVTSQNDASLQIVSIVIGLLVSIGYFLVMEALFQRTVAKFVTGTRVVTASGDRPSLGQIVGRSFARFIPFEAFSFLGGKYPVGWHDSLSGTRVVNTR